MDALLPAFLAALLGEFGDKTQWLALLLGIRFRDRPGAVLGGIAVAAIANGLIAAAGGHILHDLIGFRPLTLLLALALISAGAGSLWRIKPPELSSYGGIGAFATAAAGFFILEFGDKTQFLTLAIAARANSLWLAGLGAAAGVILAAAPAIVLGDRFRQVLPLAALRIGVAILFLLAGAIAAIAALRLV